MRRLDGGSSYTAVDDWMDDGGWAADPDAERLGDALRSTLHEQYADASDAEISDALGDVLDSMSPAEAFNFASALNQMGKSAGQLMSDPTFVSVAKVALPVLGGAAGTLVGGPVGTALGSKLGTMAAGALTARGAPPAPPAPAPPAPPAPPASAATAPAMPAPAGAPAAVVTAPPDTPAPPAPPPPPSAPAAGPLSVPPPAGSVAGGSAAAAQGLVLTQQPDVLRALLATALGQHGRQQVSGVPTAQVLSLLSQVLGQAAADADELMYTGRYSGAADSAESGPPDDSVQALYADLLGADNLELAEAAEWDGPDR
jgi:hypothetical protein